MELTPEIQSGRKTEHVGLVSFGGREWLLSSSGPPLPSLSMNWTGTPQC